LVAAQEQMAGTQQLVEDHARQRQTAEAAAQRAYNDLTAAFERAVETEQQLEHERRQFQQHLAELQAQVAAAPAEQRAAVAELAQHEAEELDLDEAQTRRIIDQQLREAGWEADTLALTYAAGIRPVRGRYLAIAEWPTANGPADYVLFVGLTPVAVVEAKRWRQDVAGSIEQAKRYSRGYTVAADQQSPGGPWGEFAVPFLFATNGRPFLRQIAEKSGIWFLDARLGTNHPRTLEAWHTPEGLSQLLQQDIAAANARLQAEPTDYLPLRDYQAQAIRTIERHIAAGRRELLVAMATGTGKTITCIGLAYRLVKSKRFRIDECHRGYNLDQEMSDAALQFRNESDYISTYRRVLDHFDAVRIGLTATPALHTTEIFGPPIFAYSYRQAVIDGWLIDHEPPYRLVTRLAEAGMTWQRAARSALPPFRRFAKGLRSDLAAVKAAATLPWSQGPIEGHINRLKMLKRQLFGWAKLDLLARRFLLAA
jgi:type I site-specific restriction endonuclease